MAKLVTMPPLAISQAELANFGATWTANGGSLSRTPPQSSGELGKLFDMAVGSALAAMLGGIPLMLGTGTGSEIRQPLGYAMVGGLIVSQALTLFTTPVIYIYLDRVSEWLKGSRERGVEAGEQPEQRRLAIPHREAAE